ncbi:hypothetical protein P879_07486 [Paragonimus westermani]|uniref:Uncharacterized protein n=1 Tax=Paragonimus westermani TaxID=34504 RepID=A0A8T0DKR4_9TREM|nr:hypothetical protein P879_07486 [Paragonimus westermani]
MELASTLSKAEVKKSLKEIAKKAKKNVPTPKYLCLSTSESLLKKVPTLLSSSSLLSSLKSAVQVYGCIPELEEYASLKELTVSCTMKHTSADKPKVPMLRRRKIKQMKKFWLSDVNHRQFWSHIFLGVNRTVRTLESFKSFPDASSSQPNPTLECILLDAGWLTSPLGHHISRLCVSSGVRLVSVKPLGALPDLFSCTLHKLKKAVAVGICTSMHAPSELISWMEQLRAQVPPLTIQLGSTVTLGAKRTAEQRNITFQDKSVDCLEQDLKKRMKTSRNNGEDWNLYKIDPQKLYIFEGQDSEKYLPSDRILTLSELWSYLTRFIRSNSDELPDHASDIARATPHTSGLLHVASGYQPAVVKLVEPQTEEQRQVQKKRKRKKKRLSLQTGPALAI